MRYTNPRLLYFALGSGATDVVTIEAYTNRDRRDIGPYGLLNCAIADDFE